MAGNLCHFNNSFVVNRAHFARVFRHPYQGLKDRGIVVTGFRKCGIFPLDPNAMDVTRPQPTSAANMPGGLRDRTFRHEYYNRNMIENNHNDGACYPRSADSYDLNFQSTNTNRTVCFPNDVACRNYSADGRNGRYITNHTRHISPTELPQFILLPPPPKTLPAAPHPLQ